LSAANNLSVHLENRNNSDAPRPRKNVERLTLYLKYVLISQKLQKKGFAARREANLTAARETLQLLRPLSADGVSDT
jgi:hypothetical protein